MRFSLGKLFFIVQSITLFLIFLDFRFSDQIYKLEKPWLISLSLIYPIIFFSGESFFLKPKIKFSFSKIFGVKISKNIIINLKEIRNLKFNFNKIPKVALFSLFLFFTNLLIFLLFLNIEINVEDIRPTLQLQSQIAEYIIFLARASQILTYINIIFFVKAKVKYKNYALIFLLNSILNALFIGYSTMSRGAMVILWLISSVSLIAKRNIYKRNADLILITSFLIISFSYIYIDILRSRDISLENILLIIPELSERVITLFNLYFLGPTIAAANALKESVQYTFGTYTFGGLIRLITSTFSNTESFEIFIRNRIDTGKGFINSYSYFYYLIRDYGLFLSFLVVYLFGLFCGYIQYLIKLGRFNMGHKLFVFITIFVLLCSPRGLITVWKSTTLAYIISLFFIFFMPKQRINS